MWLAASTLSSLNIWTLLPLHIWRRLFILKSLTNSCAILKIFCGVENRFNTLILLQLGKININRLCAGFCG